MEMNISRLKDLKFALDESSIVAFTDGKGVITDVNETFCRISEFSREELIGKTHRLINSGFHGPDFFPAMWKVIAQGHVWKGEICNRAKSGRIYWVSTTIVPLFDDGLDRPSQYIAIRQDITELKNAQEQILRQQEQLVTSSRFSALGEMAASITHEVNNPLGVILGRAEMLEEMLHSDDLNKESFKKAVDKILVTARRIEKIVKSMRNFAFQEPDSDPLESVPIKNIFEDVLDLTEGRLRSHGIELKKESLSHISPYWTVECRPIQVAQILVNLINNAHDAILSHKTPWIDIQIKENKEAFEILIVDSGLGIPPESQVEIFKPFYTSKKQNYGTGLGLSISQNLAVKNGGSLTYDASQENTTFSLRLKKPTSES